VLGPYVNAATSLPKISAPGKPVNPHTAVDDFLATQLGPGLTGVQQQAEAQSASSSNLVANQILAQTFIHSILGRQDTYTLLNSALSDTGGQFSSIYSATGPVVADALLTGSFHSGPNSPSTVPGLRLVGALQRNHNFPTAQTSSLLRAFHVAVERQVFSLSSDQANLVSSGITQFENQVTSMLQAGTFQPPVPPAAAILPKGPLGGTLEVTLGAYRNLTDIAPGLGGLQWPNVGNFPGRIDVGYVFDRAGNFGIALTARGPLAPATKGVASADVIGGDLRVGVSNAPNLSALNGTHTVEGLTQGFALSGGLEVSNAANGVSTFAYSVGYGSGLEFGTGLSYTQVIPLGNVYALVPEFPK
jgi:hypothetical protein